MPAAGFTNANSTPSSSTFFVSGPTAGSSIFDSSLFKSKSKKATEAAAASSSHPYNASPRSSSSSFMTIDREKAQAQQGTIPFPATISPPLTLSSPPLRFFTESAPKRKLDFFTVATRGFPDRSFPRAK
ncbi:hypothetical protein MMC13_004366 [Lambiella insularis]|nr:hypothetical protein [Lambiella insularis]